MSGKHKKSWLCLLIVEFSFDLRKENVADEKCFLLRDMLLYTAMTNMRQYFIISYSGYCTVFISYFKHCRYTYPK